MRRESSNRCIPFLALGTSTHNARCQTFVDSPVVMHRTSVCDKLMEQNPSLLSCIGRPLLVLRASCCIREIRVCLFPSTTQYEEVDDVYSPEVNNKSSWFQDTSDAHSPSKWLVSHCNCRDIHRKGSQVGCVACAVRRQRDANRFEDFDRFRHRQNGTNRTCADEDRVSSLRLGSGVFPARVRIPSYNTSGDEWLQTITH